MYLRYLVRSMRLARRGVYSEVESSKNVHGIIIQMSRQTKMQQRVYTYSGVESVKNMHGIYK